VLWSSTALDLMGRPTESWNGKDSKGVLLPSGTYAWKIDAVFIDGTIWKDLISGKGIMIQSELLH